MTALEKCMESLIVIFHRYAVQDGDGKTLSKRELKKLIDEELPSFIKAQKNTQTVECIMKDLDLNKDDKLDFEEFLPLVAGLALACEKCYNLHEKKGKKQ
ncbi:protein S100-A1-like [Antennarius striatus]|uniref:protein S100-A1-like n=1 Tax=Antennarius striatus TaxID=241820 RepID=UPI0035B13C28